MTNELLLWDDHTTDEQLIKLVHCLSCGASAPWPKEDGSPRSDPTLPQATPEQRLSISRGPKIGDARLLEWPFCFLVCLFSNRYGRLFPFILIHVYALQSVRYAVYRFTHAVSIVWEIQSGRHQKDTFQCQMKCSK